MAWLEQIELREVLYRVGLRSVPAHLQVIEALHAEGDLEEMVGGDG